VHKAVKENNEKETGITIHYVSEAYDKGTFIFQNKVALTTTDTICDIEAKVSALEQEYFPKVINSLLNNI
jgi:phosphoribosylglycinamide formyltransferase-1